MKTDMSRKNDISTNRYHEETVSPALTKIVIGDLNSENCELTNEYSKIRTPSGNILNCVSEVRHLFSPNNNKKRKREIQTSGDKVVIKGVKKNSQVGRPPKRQSQRTVSRCAAEKIKGKARKLARHASPRNKINNQPSIDEFRTNLNTSDSSYASVNNSSSDFQETDVTSNCSISDVSLSFLTELSKTLPTMPGSRGYK